MQSNVKALQQEIANELGKKYDFDPKHVHFLNPNNPQEYWLGSTALIAIGVQSDKVASVIERFDQYVPGLDEVVYAATVTLQDGKMIERSGCAGMKEKIAGSNEVAPHALASARAIRRALKSAGLNPDNLYEPKTKFVNELPGTESQTGEVNLDDAETRNAELAEVHILARKLGYITGQGKFVNVSLYRNRLADICKEAGWPVVTSAGAMSQRNRQAVIAKFNNELQEMANQV